MFAQHFAKKVSVFVGDQIRCYTGKSKRYFAGSSFFFSKNRGLCVNKEPSNDSVAIVRSENRLINLVYVRHGCSEVHCRSSNSKH